MGFGKFFEKNGSVLTAFSIFLFLFFEVINSDHLNIEKEGHGIVLALVFGLIMIMAIFLSLEGAKSKNIIVRVFGLVLLALPLLLYEILESNIKTNLFSGAYIVFLTVSLFSGIGLVYWIFEKLENKFKMRLRGFYLYNLLFAITLFILFKYFNLALYIHNWLPEFSGLGKALFLGLQIGIFIGLVAAPASLFLMKLSDYIELKRKKR